MELMNALPAAIREELRGLDMSRACDIRLLADRPCAVTTMEGEIRTRACVSGQEIYDAAQALSRRTLRMSPASTGAGFLTLRGGHRMGLCGRVTCERDGLVLREIGSLCLRIAHEVKGCGADTARMLRGGGALIAGPPGRGKTTLLRDIVRILSDEGTAVGLCDERGEIAACVEGVPQLDVGARTHVLDGCGKASGLRWLLRAMCPGLLAVDELYGSDECLAVREAAACGVPVLTTLHAATGREVCLRTGIEDLLAEGIFEQVIFVRERRVTCVLPAAEVLKQGCCGQ